MNYTTIEEFISRVGTSNMNDLMNEYDTEDVETRQAEMLNEAEDLVNSFACGTYSIPMYASPSVASHVVKGWTYNLAQYSAYINMEGDDIPKRIERQYAATMEMLLNLAEGKLKPPPGTDGTKPAVNSSGNSVSLAYDEAVFDSDSMEVF